MRFDHKTAVIPAFCAVLSAALITLMPPAGLVSGDTGRTRQPSPDGSSASIEAEADTRQTEATPQSDQSAGTRQMAQLLEQLGADFDRRLLDLRPDPNLARYL